MCVLCVFLVSNGGDASAAIAANGISARTIVAIVRDLDQH